MEIPPPYEYARMFIAWHTNPTNWEIYSHSAFTYPGNVRTAYYNYDIKLVSTDDSRTKAVKITNTGSYTMTIFFKVRYRFLTADAITHEESVPETLSVRAVDNTSIQKYGRRVMNLTWEEGTNEVNMQSLVNHYRDRYSEPIGRLVCTIKGTTDTLRTQIITREISDLVTVVCTNLGLNADCFINSISITDGPVGIPVAIWGLEIQRTYELLTLFKLDTSELDGAHILGS